MGKSTYNDDFKRDAVHQILVRGYAVREVSERLGGKSPPPMPLDWHIVLRSGPAGLCRLLRWHSKCSADQLVAVSKHLANGR